MIAVQELRIGNHVQLFRRAEDKEMTHHKVKSIYFDDDEGKYFVELEDGFRVNIDAGIEPIALTEDILIEYGFKEDILWEDSYPVFYKEDFGLQCHSWNKDELYYDNDVEVKTLHHLQNIYFDIKQKELQKDK